MPPPFSWGTPGIDKPAPTNTAHASPVPTRFKTLSFNPQGVYDLRRMLGALPSRPGEYTAHQRRFDAADVAWFAAGCSTDGQHAIDRHQFHPIMTNMYLDGFGPDSRRDLKDLTQSLLFDTATLLDRAFGGATMVIHFDCRTAPGTPASPEHLKAKVYLPPSTIISELPESHGPLASVVQTFMENVALHTKLRWEHVGKVQFGWKLESKGPTPKPLPIIQPFVIATPPGSSVYIVHGRPFSQARHSTSPSTSAISVSSSEDSSITAHSNAAPDDDDMYVVEEPSSSYMAAFTEVDWQLEKKGFQEREDNYLREISDLRQCEQQLQDRIRELEQDHIRLQLELAHETGLRGTASNAVAVQSSAAASPVHKKLTSPHPPPPSPFFGPLNSPFVHMGNDPESPPKKKVGSSKLGMPATPMSKMTRKRQPETPSAQPTFKSPFAQVLRDSSVDLGQRSPSPSPSRPFQRSITPDPPAPSVDKEPTDQAGTSVSRAAFLANFMGYSNVMSALLNFFVVYVPPAFWSKELTKNGFKNEHIDALLTAMVNDHAELR